MSGRPPDQATHLLENIHRAWLLALLLALSLAACRQVSVSERSVRDMAIHVESSAYGDGGNIPVKYSCDGQNVSPPLKWSGVPEGTQSLVLIMDDPDAPAGTFTHWLLYDLPADTRELPEGAGNRTTGGIGTAGQNSRRQQGYTGPCPPSGSNHRYIVTLYALDKQLGLGPGANKRQVLEAIEGHILAEGQLMGRYARR